MAKKIVWGILLGLILAFIWGNSMLSREASSAESSGVLGFVTPLLEIFVGKGNVTHHMVRKLAHFAEFAALGFGLYGNILPLAKKKFRLLLTLNLGFFAAFLDESIQILSGRGPQIQDVWLDFSGTVAGALVSFALQKLLPRLFPKENLHKTT